MIHLDRQGSLPLYEQIYNYMKDAIESGLYEPGDRLPSIRQLAAENGVSRITVEQAYVQLAMEGYVKGHNRAPYEVLPLGEILYKSRLGYDADHHDKALLVTANKDKSNGSVSRKTSLGEDYVVNRTWKERELKGFTNDDMYYCRISERGRSLEGNEYHEGELQDAYPPRDFNFATGAMDPEGFDFSRWKRYVGYILREPRRLMSYGDELGEGELRHELGKYLREARGVRVHHDGVIISSGTQPSLQMVASLLKQRGLSQVAVEAQAPTMVRSVFDSYGYTVHSVSLQEEDCYSTLEDLGIEVLYCMPSHGDGAGRIMPIAQRRNLLHWAQRQEAFILEDDYDSELRYYGKPIPSLQSLDIHQGVIYLGTPSKVLPPSIRLSYVVLPPSLWDQFLLHRKAYRQSASVVEQLVWARYIKDGQWERQIRRLRKHYLEKSKYMVKLLRQYVSDTFTIEAPEGGVYVSITWKGDLLPRTLWHLARQQGCDVKVIHQGESREVLVSVSAIETDRLEEGIRRLGTAWKGL